MALGKITSLSEEEMKMFMRKPSDIAKEAVAKTGDAAAIAAMDEMAGMFKGVHDGLGDWILAVMDGLYRAEGGEKALFDCMYAYERKVWGAMSEGYWDKSFHDRVVMSINGARMYHDVAVAFDGEDDEKLTFHMDPCGSGQRFYEMGCYEEPMNMAKCSAHCMTAGFDEFPVYCVHAPLGEMGAIDACGYPLWVIDYANPIASCACKYTVYKRKEDIPERYYTRLGMKKPESK